MKNFIFLIKNDIIEPNKDYGGIIMIPKEKNPEYLNSFLNYSITILNKSPNSVKEYN